MLPAPPRSSSVKYSPLCWSYLWEHSVPDGIGRKVTVAVSVDTAAKPATPSRFGLWVSLKSKHWVPRGGRGTKALGIQILNLLSTPIVGRSSLLSLIHTARMLGETGARTVAAMYDNENSPKTLKPVTLRLTLRTSSTPEALLMASNVHTLPIWVGEICGLLSPRRISSGTPAGNTSSTASISMMLRVWRFSVMRGNVLPVWMPDPWKAAFAFRMYCIGCVMRRVAGGSHCWVSRIVIST
mmetsp:Transcript_45830/g.121137  ORF Transcript_45830/g.121137 Transcript_45830/m.121137 type:complete len:240 (-) Transcript_45830:898-1617(-)